MPENPSSAEADKDISSDKPIVLPPASANGGKAADRGDASRAGPGSPSTTSVAGARILAEKKYGADDCLPAQQLEAFRETVLAKKLTDEVADEASAIFGVAQRIRSRNYYVESAAARMRFALNCLLAEPPNLILARDERMRLQLDTYANYARLNPARILASLTPAVMIIAALAASVVLWLVAVLVVAGLSNLHASFVSGIAQNAFFMSDTALLAILPAALIGGVISVVTRLGQYSRVQGLDPWGTFLTVFLKPLIGVVLSIFILAALSGNMISFGFLAQGDLALLNESSLLTQEDGAKAHRVLYILWVFGFLAGFSERFAWDFVDRAEGVASGKGADQKANAG